MRSFSEIDTTVKRACRGAGFSWGISEEVGKNIKLLELYGLPGLKNLSSYLKMINEKKFQNISLISKNNSSKIPYCPIISGINFLGLYDVLILLLFFSCFVISLIFDFNRHALVWQY